MTENYHTHTARCRHAAGTEEEYVLQAIAGGLKVLGFSDHTPFLFPNGYCSRIRMYPEELEGYVSTVLTHRYSSRFGSGVLSRQNGWIVKADRAIRYGILYFGTALVRK